MKRGFFITFEGIEGCGKSTQLEFLREELERAGREVLSTRSPGGTPVAEAIRDLLKRKRDDEDLRPETELLLFAACHSQSLSGLVEPALASGKDVLCDRLYDSTTAYQGYARGLPLETLRMINAFSCRGVKPDMTILLDMPPEEALKRALSRGGEKAVQADRFDSESLLFHAKVRAGFLELAKAEPGRFRIFDATETKDALRKKIAEAVSHGLQLY